MSIVFISNFINEHQIPLCEELYKISNGEFQFVATEPFWKERIDLGFVDQSDRLPYVVKSYESDSLKNRIKDQIFNADIVILGDAPISFVDKRILNGKLTYRYTERYFKKSRLSVLDPRIIRYRYKVDFRYRKLPFYLLCAGAYTAGDAALVFSYPDKMFKWGYFPKTITYEDIKTVIDEKDSNSLMWAGRFIDWKHPEVPIEIAMELKQRNVKFKLTMIGTGVLLDKMKKLVERYGLSDTVIFTGALPPEDVRKQMKKNEIFVFSSDRNEGWGAVLNESMNAACVPIANKMIGSAPFVLNHGVNGFVYSQTDIKKITDIVVDIFNKPQRKREIAEAAYKTIINQWNAENAAKRLVELSEVLKQGKQSVFSDGVCSKAEIM